MLDIEFGPSLVSLLNLLLNISSTELQIYEAMNGDNSLADIAQKVRVNEEQVKSVYKKFWDFDLVMFRT